MPCIHHNLKLPNQNGMECSYDTHLYTQRMSYAGKSRQSKIEKVPRDIESEKVVKVMADLGKFVSTISTYASPKKGWTQLS